MRASEKDRSSASAPPRVPDERLVPVGWRVGWIVAVVLLPVVWGGVALFAGPSDGTATYPSTALNDEGHWDAGKGLPISAYHGDDGLVSSVDPDHPAHVLAVGPYEDDGEKVQFDDSWTLPSRTRSVDDVLCYEVRPPPKDRSCVPVTLDTYPLGEVVAANLWVLPLYAGLIVAGGIAFWKRPRDPAARALLSLGAFVPSGLTAFPAGVQVIDLAGGRGVWPQVVGDVFNTLAWGSMLLFALVFPEPIPALARRPWLKVTPYAFLFALYGVSAAAALVREDSALGRVEALVSISAPAAKVALPLIVAVLIWSYRRASIQEHRLALRVVLLGVLVCGFVYLGTGQVSDLFLGHPLIPLQFLALGLAAPLATIVAAVLRYRLFDVDLIVRRSLLATGVAAAVGGGFLAVAWVVVREVVSPNSLPEDPAVVLVAAAVVGALVGAVLTPVAGSLRRQLGRWAYGERENPYEVVTRLRSLEAGARLDEVLRGVLDTLTRTLRLSYAAIEITEPDGLVRSVSIGRTDRPPTIVVLSTGGEEIGRLLLDVPVNREQLGPGDRRLLDDVGAHVGAIVQAMVMNEALSTSRQRILTAREEERRRIKHDLHDGMGPLLANLRMQLTLAQYYVSEQPEKATQLLADLTQQAQVAIDENRRLGEGLRPAALDQLGLVSALRQTLQQMATSRQDLLALEGRDTRFTWTLEDDGIVDLPAAVEGAVYKIVVEAINNVIKHSDGTTCSVRLARPGNVLTATVADNGHGIPARRGQGVGMSSMQERTEELGGTFLVRSNPDTGTTVTVRIPLSSR